MFDELQGNWEVVSIELNGQDMLGNVKGVLTVVTGDEFTFGLQIKGRLLPMDVASTPRKVDFLFTEGGNEGRGIFPGIYVLNGDAWKICMAPPGQDRPKEFVTRPGTDHYAQTLKRAAAE